MTRQPRTKSGQAGLSRQGADTQQQRESRIREAAYYRYLEHGCCDGHDVDDWLEAEAEISRVAVEPARSLQQDGLQGRTRGATPDQPPKRTAKRQPGKALAKSASIEPPKTADR